MPDEWESIPICEFSFAVYDVGSGEVDTFDPDSDATVTYGPSNQSGSPQLQRGDAEQGVQALYCEQGYQVRDINHKYGSPLRTALRLKDTVEDRYSRSSPESWTAVKTRMCNLIRQHASADSDQAALDQIDITGIPDLLVRQRASPERFFFVEVKRPQEKLGADQRDWIWQFQFLPIKIAKIFPEQPDRDRYVETTTVEDILSDVREESSPERSDLPATEIAARLSDIEPGDQLIFNDRVEPCTVVETGVTSSGLGDELTGVQVKTSQGNQYLFSADGDWYRGSMYRRQLEWVKIISN